MESCIRVTASVRVDIVESTWMTVNPTATEVIINLPASATEDQTNRAVIAALDTLSNNVEML